MKQRVLSGAVLVVLVAAVVVFYQPFPLILQVVIALVGMAAVYEIAAAVGLNQNAAFLLPSLLLAIVFPFAGWTVWGAFFLFLYTVLLFLTQLRYHAQVSFSALAILYSMSLLIPLALSALEGLHRLGGEYGMFYMILGLAAAWVSDVGAFFGGKLFGKHKLAPRISPKKTVEGVVGGVVLNLLFMMAAGFFAGFFYGRDVFVSYPVLFVLAIGGTAISVLGDLSFSLVKRSCTIKDFGKVIPGHGGILDRFDGVIFTAPLTYFLLTVLPIIQ